jgi:hypothetical protein
MSENRFIADLAAHEDSARLERKQAIEDATEEYLLGRLRGQRDQTFHPLSVKDVAFKYNVKPGQIEHKIFRLRELRQREIAAGQEDAGMLNFLGELLNSVSESVAEKRGR